MDIQNLREQDIEALAKEVDKLKQENPDITTRVYEMEKPPSLEDIYQKLCSIELRLSNTFNEHILINGIWRKP